MFIVKLILHVIVLHVNLITNVLFYFTCQITSLIIFSLQIAQFTLISKNYLILYRNDIYLIEMMNQIILGLLSKKDLTVYDIKIAMDKSISKFYSNSFGSINPAIKKLEKEELISCSERIDKSRLKKIYSITSKGRAAYANWISEPIQPGRIKDEVLLKVFFLGDAKKATQQTLIQEYLEQLATSKHELEATKQSIAEMKLTPEDQEKIKFQIATIQFGIDYIAFKEKWFQNLFNEL